MRERFLPLVQFLPLSLFATYAFWHGAPTNERWVEAFKLGGIAALVQLAIVLPQRRPADRLILGANLYLVAGGVAAFTRQWWFLGWYGLVGPAGIFMFMFVVGAVTTFATSASFLAVPGAAPARARRYSLVLLAATLAAVVATHVFGSDGTRVAALAVLALALLRRALAARLAVSSGSQEDTRA